MYQGTTPALTFSVPDFNAMGMNAFVSFKKGQEVLTKTGDDVVIAYDSEASKSIIVCMLTQQETLDMRAGEYDVQIRFIDESGAAYATEESKMDVKRVLYNALISYS